ncbi:MAG: hypothetical protein AB7V46_17270 [Thermomicrobiales bacterium]
MSHTTFNLGLDSSPQGHSSVISDVDTARHHDRGSEDDSLADRDGVFIDEGPKPSPTSPVVLSLPFAMGDDRRFADRRAASPSPAGRLACGVRNDRDREPVGCRKHRLAPDIPLRETTLQFGIEISVQGRLCCPAGRRAGLRTPVRLVAQPFV